MNKFKMFNEGVSLVRAFCALNTLSMPEIYVSTGKEWRFRACAFYRIESEPHIEICIEKCAMIGKAGPAWSYPGNTVDRTPYGVLAHEIGHHADCIKGGAKFGYMSEYSVAVRKESDEIRLTSYCPNDAEWFAEMFRLFVTNPDLLSILRPRTYAIIARDFKPLDMGTWDTVLRNAPERTIAVAAKRVGAVG